MLIHAVAVLALGAAARTSGRYGSLVAAIVLLTGTVFFAGDLALAGLLDWRPLPIAAPIGGSLLIVGWFLIPIAALVEAFGPKRR